MATLLTKHTVVTRLNIGEHREVSDFLDMDVQLIVVDILGQLAISAERPKAGATIPATALCHVAAAFCLVLVGVIVYPDLRSASFDFHPPRLHLFR
jgi:hypothetical protein